MRATFFPAVWGCACVLSISGCAYEHPGPSLPDDNPLPPPLGAAAPAAVPPASPKVKPAPTARSSTATVNTSTPVAPVNKPVAKPVTPIFPVWHEQATPAPHPDPGAGSTSGPGHESEGSDPGSSFDNLDVVDASLKGKLAILRVGSEPTPNNLLSVFAGLKNRTAHPLALEVQTIYRDKAGNELNAGSWIPMTLKPHEETDYRSASISTEATDFLIRIRRVPPGN